MFRTWLSSYKQSGDKVNEEGLLTALPGVPDDELLVVAHRPKDVLVVIVPGHVLHTADAHQA